MKLSRSNHRPKLDGSLAEPRTRAINRKKDKTNGKKYEGVGSRRSITIPDLNWGQDVAKSAKSVWHIAEDGAELTFTLGDAPIMNQLLETVQR